MRQQIKQLMNNERILGLALTNAMRLWTIFQLQMALNKFLFLFQGNTIAMIAVK